MRKLMIVSCFLISNSVFADEDPCSIVLERAAANISYRFGSATSSATQANALCDERYEKMSSTEQEGLEASYKLFAASYSTAGSSLKEYRSKYCNSGRSSYFSASQSTDYSSQIYDASIAAWRDCKFMQSANVIISPVRAPDDRSVTFSIAYRGPGTAKLKGISISPKNSFICTGEGDKRISGHPDQKLSGDSFSFDCERNVKLGRGPNEFSANAASITVTTTATTRPFMLYFPAVTSPDIRTENAFKLNKSIDDLNSRLNANISAVNVLESKKPKLTCTTQKEKSPNKRNPKIAVNAPTNGVWQLVGGGCEVIGNLSHRASYVKSTPAGNTFECEVGDPPNIPMEYTLEATGIYCSVDN